ncbi:unnamed protein product [Thlaspi arvense]|uniref:Polygalacturonase n=1 Tax=Thlaspi arvense TaxID=13288 RepID=A0AAU9T5B7_THLAR|nr:unnamed protein product [Thlaspi arvense]
MKIKMAFELLFWVVLIASFCLQYGDGRMTLSITDFLSDSDNTNADHSQAFQDAWKALCKAKGGKEAPSLIIHANETYTVRPQLFQGPCVSRNLHIRIDGTIEAPKTVREWGSQRSEYWLCFERVTGLVLDGSGLLNPHGAAWWSSVAANSRPEAMRFSGCKDIIYNGLTQLDSPKIHIAISGCINATLSNLHLIAPANSPNTDGIDISFSHNIRILSSSIKTGDDCVAIRGGSYDINVTRVTCGPGHGISIGSLGREGATDTVQNVNVRHCTFTGTQNGARIKTWDGGRGFAKNILYEDITLINAQFPIIIDQHYCNGGHCTTATAVKVSDVTFRYFKGTCADAIAIKLDCDQKVGCDNIVMEHINITSSAPKTPLSAYCQFANVIRRFVNIPIRCGSHKLLQPLAPYSDQPPSPYPQPQPPAPHAQSSMFSSFLYFM